MLGALDAFSTLDHGFTYQNQPYVECPSNPLIAHSSPTTVYKSCNSSSVTIALLKSYVLFTQALASIPIPYRANAIPYAKLPDVESHRSRYHRYSSPYILRSGAYSGLGILGSVDIGCFSIVSPVSFPDPNNNPAIYPTVCAPNLIIARRST